MNTLLIQALGFLAIALSALAYLPQINHLIRERCTVELSLRAYSIWTVAATLFLSYAISRWDPVFILLYAYQLIATIVVLYFAVKYKGQLCEEHGGKPLAKRFPSIKP